MASGAAGSGTEGLAPVPRRLRRRAWPLSMEPRTPVATGAVTNSVRVSSGGHDHSTTIPAHRLQLSDVAPRQFAAMARLSGGVELDPALGELVDIRASQINGCAFCLDMHWKDARDRGEPEERLALIPAWREVPAFDDRERAALALCEAMTLVAETNVPGDVWAEAEAQFAPEELAQLVFAIAAVNAWNRLCVATRVEPGHYVPGMFAR